MLKSKKFLTEVIFSPKSNCHLHAASNFINKLLRKAKPLFQLLRFTSDLITQSAKMFGLNQSQVSHKQMFFRKSI